MIPLADHIALCAYSESLFGDYGHQLRKLLGPEKSLNIVSNPDVSRSIFDFQGNLLILIMAQDGCLLQERAEVPIIETALIENDLHSRPVNRCEVRILCFIPFAHEWACTKGQI